MKINRHFFPLAFLPAVSGVALAASKGPAWNTGADERKADYTFMEAQRYLADEENDCYYELMRSAYALDPSESSVAMDLGMYEFILADNDSAAMAEAYRKIKYHFDTDPADLFSSLMFGSINDRLGRRDVSMSVWRKLHDIYPARSEVTIRLADALASRSLDSAMQREALALIDTIIVANGPSLALTSRKVNSYLNLRDTVSTKAELNEFIKSSPANPEARVYAGDIYMLLGEPQPALDLYKEACDVDPSSGLAYFKLAEYYKNVGDSVGYDREVFQALSMADVDLDTKLEILTEYVRELYTDTLQQPRINDLFTTLIDLYPHEEAVHNLYSSYFVAVGEYESAAEQQEYVTDANPSNIKAWNSTISLYISAGNFAKALSAAERAISNFPDELRLYLSAGESSAMVGELDKAEELYKTAMASSRMDPLLRSQFMTARGDLQYKRGDLDGAIVYYDSALVDNPLNAMAMNNYAYFLACDGRELEKAEKLSKRSLDISPDNPSSLDTYAWIQFKLRNYNIAKEYIDRTMELSDEFSADMLDHAGDIYFMNDLVDEAVDFWEKALQLDPGNSEITNKVKRRRLN